ncbi:dihydroxyacetone kinase DhaK subunit [Pseudovibrio denitrificans]|uniref:phosphoenolpyruvate--glycerone phosphotransferase n=1 Tax=Pseudovibrio denitrificans TaxID=258256 RepID=A0A1I7DT13_9HYPH|nr:dihydroxyacetone kinase subunit DhaK [Pseudovibrio denitrificans]SFU14803.1 dihydroxyacetone kinase DhaK subunit [Pseudovibrio denitrificans]
MKKLINRVEDVVAEQLAGMRAARPELKFSEEPRYIWREDNEDKISLISGGGSGHEPLHAGYIGKGMLTAACPGEVFTSPTPDQMYECGKEVNNGKGVLFFIKNYTGDVLNFESAVELLHFDDIPVGSITIDDDVAVKDSLYTAGRRGVGATVLIEKIVGAAAEAGYDLAQCEELTLRLNNRARSFGVALSACTVPANGKPSFELADNEIEFGVGIHGEPGIERRSYSDLNTLVEQMCDEIINTPAYTRTVRTWDREVGEWKEQDITTEEFKQGDQFIVMVNGLGGTTQGELYGVYGKMAECFDKAGYKLARNLVGNYCTALDMEGFSITLLKADEETLKLWDVPVNAPALRWGV